MKWFEFSQNNSGGSFQPPSRYCFIEASNADEANHIAQKMGIYFDGCDSGVDCPCCGDRWYPCRDDSGMDVVIIPRPFGRVLATAALRHGDTEWTHLTIVDNPRYFLNAATITEFGRSMIEEGDARYE